MKDNVRKIKGRGDKKKIEDVKENGNDIWRGRKISEEGIVVDKDRKIMNGGEQKQEMVKLLSEAKRKKEEDRVWKQIK